MNYIHDLYGNCAQNVVKNILLRCNRDYTHLNATGWSVHYFTEKNLPFGERLDIYRQDFTELIEFMKHKYNIMMVKKVLPKQCYHEYIRKLLSKNIPICLYLDSYYCSWQMGYQRLHNNHMIIVEDISINGYMCADPYLNKSNLYLDESAFLSAICAVYVFFEGENIPVIEKDIVKEAAYTQIIAPGTECQLKLLANDICCEKEVLLEELFATEPAFVKLTRKITNIAYGRKSFFDYLLLKEEALSINSNIMDSYSEVVDSWMKVMNLFIKISVVRRDAPYLDKIVDYINNLAELETKVARMIINNYNGGNNYVVQRD